MTYTIPHAATKTELQVLLQYERRLGVSITAKGHFNGRFHCIGVLDAEGGRGLSREGGRRGRRGGGQHFTKLLIGIDILPRECKLHVVRWVWQLVFISDRTEHRKMIVACGSGGSGCLQPLGNRNSEVDMRDESSFVPLLLPAPSHLTSSTFSNGGCFIVMADNSKDSIDKGSTLIYSWGEAGTGFPVPSTEAGVSTPVVSNYLVEGKVTEIAGSRNIKGFRMIHDTLHFILDNSHRSNAPLLFFSVVCLSVGWSHACIALAGGGIMSWGLNAHHQVGRSTPGIAGEHDTIPRVIPSLTRFQVASVACGRRHTACIATDLDSCVDGNNKIIMCWGNSRKGALGLGKDILDSLDPSIVKFDGVYDFTQICCGWDFTAAVCGSGKVYTWGDNKHGQLCRDIASSSPFTPARVSDDLPLISKLSTGWTHALALTSSHQAVTWGRNNYGQRGVGDVSSHPGFSVLSAPESIQGSVVDIACGSEHCLLLTAKGSLFTWGWNEHGNLGHGDRDNYTAPQLVKGLSAHRVVGISAGGAVSIAELEEKV